MVKKDINFDDIENDIEENMDTARDVIQLQYKQKQPA